MKRGEVGKDAGGAGGVEFGGGVRAGGHGPAGEAGVEGGLDIERRVADHERGGSFGAELGEEMRGEGGFGLEPRGVLGAEVGVQERRKSEVVGNQAGRGAMLVGKDRELGAAGMKIAQKGEGAGEGGDVLKHGGVPIRAVDCDGGGDLVGTDKVEHRVFEATAHGGADLGEGGRGEAELGQGVGVGAVDRGEVVDERAIEIEEKGAKGHDGCKVGQGRWAVVSGSEVSG